MDDLQQILETSRKKQGLPPGIEDPAFLERVAHLLGPMPSVKAPEKAQEPFPGSGRPGHSAGGESGSNRLS